MTINLSGAVSPKDIGVGVFGRWPANVVLLPRPTTPASHIESKLLDALNTLGPFRDHSQAGERDRAISLG
jgi:hypothetical protein